MNRLARLLALLLLATAPCQAGVSYRTLTFLHVNDIHGQLFPFVREGRSIGGSERQATLFRTYGGAQPRVVVACAGDIWNRGPLEGMKGRVDIGALNLEGCEVWTPGNGEFYAGVPNLLARTRQAQFPCISANVHTKDGAYLTRPWVIMNLDGIRVGVLGLTAPRIATYSTTGGLNVEDPVAAAQRAVAELRGRCDVIVALTHIGFLSDLALASSLPDIDLIIGGDSHTELDQPVMVGKPRRGAPLEFHATPVAQAGDLGRFVGFTRLYLRREDSGPWTVVLAEGRLLPVDSSVPSDPAVKAYLAPYLRRLRGGAGTLVEAVPASRDGCYPLGELAARFARECSGADIGVYNVHGVGADGLPAGRLRKMDIARAFPYENRLVVARLSREQIQKLLALEESRASGAELSGEAAHPSLQSVGGNAPEDGHIYSVATTDWQLKSALGDLPAKDLGDFNALLGLWISKNSPLKP